MANINKYLKALLNPAGGHQGGHKAHQAGNQLFTVFYLKFVPIIRAAQSGGLVRHRPILTGRKNGLKIRPNRLSRQQDWSTTQTTHI